MAIYHFKLKVIKRRAGPSIVGSAAYRAGEKIYDEKSDQTYDYKPRKRGIVHTEILAPNSAPDWVYDRSRLWNAVELTEKRKDSQLAREIMVALPTELNQVQQIKLVRAFIFQWFIKKGMIADFAIHAPSKQGDERNYHVHILLTMRNITREGFGLKAREWNAKSCIYQWRQAWEKQTNQALQQAGLDCRVDCRSHASKGLDREPLRHLGFEATAIERKGGQSDRGNENRAIAARNEMRVTLHSEQARAGGESVNLFHDVVSQPLARPLINDIPSSKNNIDDSDPDEIANKTQHDEPSLKSLLKQQIIQSLSLEERKEALEQNNKAFEERKVELNCLIENAPDEKTKDRLRLQEQLESSYFTESYNKIRASILDEEDPQKNVNEIVASQQRARKASNKYQKCVAEWNSRAVRDSDYLPTDQKSMDKINIVKEVENKKWIDFAMKAEKNGWNPSRIERERQILQKRMDYELASNFSISRGRSMGR